MANQPIKPPERLLNIPEIANFCNVSEKTIRRWIQTGKMPAARLGNQLRIRPRDLDDFVGVRLTR